MTNERIIYKKKEKYKENIRQSEFDHGLFTNLLRVIVVCYFFSEFIQSQKRYPTTLDAISVLTWKVLLISS